MTPTRESIRAVLDADQLERQKREAEHVFANVSDDDLEALASAEIIGADADLSRTDANFRLELERRRAERQR
jgi:hypothetical protein